VPPNEAAPDTSADRRLDADALFTGTDPERLGFETTADVEQVQELVGQARVMRAITFGIGVRGRGFNIYALGAEETDKRTVVLHHLEDRAEAEPVPPDLCYVNNFDEPHRPRALEVPSGVGRRLCEAVDDFLDDLTAGLEGAFESEEYQARKQSVQEEAEEEQQEALEELQEKARERDLALIRTPRGFAFAPVRDGEVVPMEEFQGRPEEERKKVQEAIAELQKILRRVPRRRREVRETLDALNEELARATVTELLDEVRADFEELDEVQDFFDEVLEDVVSNVDAFIQEEGEGGPGRAMAAQAGESGPAQGGGPPLRRYKVNLLVDHAETEHAPVIHEDHPIYQNLLGRVEYLTRMGTLVTDFNLIRPGCLHRANGGFLVLEAHQLLLQPFAWQGLKRSLTAGEVKIESPREAMGMVSTVSLEPEPIPIDLKVVLLGSRRLYYLLAQLDPDFGDLFKVAADFDDELDRSEENERLFARVVADLVKKEELRPFDAPAVARVIERSARKVGDGAKLTARSRRILDLVRAADFWAREDGAEVVSEPHVQQAIDAWVHRSSRIRERLQEQILRDTILVDTEGDVAGQVNGLAVLQLGDYAFGKPNRITARVRLGKGEVTDIEREAELGGPIHSKGVMILAGFLGARYATDHPLSVAASLVFEQSYGGVEGDSASSAELYALLSAIGDIPLRQGVAVTGSVNQHGRVQAIGGVNEKIEGFFEICRERGLDGRQGVIIPTSNVKHLMLRAEVVDAVREGDFNVWAVESVDRGMEILSGLPMGEPDEDGRYPEGTVNRRVKDRLREMAHRWSAFAREREGGDGS